MKNKGTVFVEHIQKHLKEVFPENANVNVICKICGKSVEEIYQEYKKEVLGVSPERGKA